MKILLIIKLNRKERSYRRADNGISDIGKNPNLLKGLEDD
jgi:hypothetical protein